MDKLDTIGQQCERCGMCFGHFNMQFGHLQQVLLDSFVNWLRQIGGSVHKGQKLAEMRMGKHPEALHFGAAAWVFKAGNDQPPKNFERHQAQFECL